MNEYIFKFCLNYSYYCNYTYVNKYTSSKFNTFEYGYF